MQGAWPAICFIVCVVCGSDLASKCHSRRCCCLILKVCLDLLLYVYMKSQLTVSDTERIGYLVCQLLKVASQQAQNLPQGYRRYDKACSVYPRPRLAKSHPTIPLARAEAHNIRAQRPSRNSNGSDNHSEPRYEQTPSKLADDNIGKTLKAASYQASSTTATGVIWTSAAACE